MRIALNRDDLDRLRHFGFCNTQFLTDEVSLTTTVLRDEFTTEPIAETNGHEVTVYLPLAGVRLPLDVPVHQVGPAARFYFGEAGKICLRGEALL